MGGESFLDEGSFILSFYPIKGDRIGLNILLTVTKFDLGNNWIWGTMVRWRSRPKRELQPIGRCHQVLFLAR
jgi:hypothetical protein